MRQEEFASGARERQYTLEWRYQLSEQLYCFSPVTQTATIHSELHQQAQHRVHNTLFTFSTRERGRRRSHIRRRVLLSTDRLPRSLGHCRRLISIATQGVITALKELVAIGDLVHHIGHHLVRGHQSHREHLAQISIPRKHQPTLDMSGFLRSPWIAYGVVGSLRIGQDVHELRFNTEIMKDVGTEDSLLDHRDHHGQFGFPRRLREQTCAGASD